jgi:hypothetical protein
MEEKKEERKNEDRIEVISNPDPIEPEAWSEDKSEEEYVRKIVVKSQEPKPKKKTSSKKRKSKKKKKGKEKEIENLSHQIDDIDQELEEVQKIIEQKSHK